MGRNLGITIGALVLLTACNPMYTAKHKAQAGGSVSLEQVRKLTDTSAEAILKRKCSMCHNETLALGAISSVTDWQYLTTRRLVVPGHPESSPLYNSMVARRMPASNDWLDEVELSVISDWIKTGAGAALNSQHSCLESAAQLSQPKPARLWPITKSQYANMIQDTFGVSDDFYSGLPEDIDQGGFKNNFEHLTFDSALAFQLQSAADRVSIRIAGDAPTLQRFWTCAGSLTSVTAACVAKLINDLGLALFRRPLAADEITRYTSLYQSVAGETAAAQFGAKLVLEAMLVSPNFLYRKEFGGAPTAGARPMTGYQIAEFLSFTITDTSPDPALRTLAATNQILDQEVRGAEITRLLKTARGQKFMARFFADLLDIDVLQKIALPVGDAAGLQRSLATEFELFVTNALLAPDSLAAVLSGRDTFADKNLGDNIYGLSGRDQTFRSYLMPSNQRAGILSLPAFLVSTSNLGGGRPYLKRGRMVKERLLCQPLGVTPPLPSEMNTRPPNFDQLSPREKFESVHLTNKSCASCHAQIDPIGFGMHQFTPIGAFTSADPEGGVVQDVRGHVTGTADSDFQFTGAAQLGEGLARSREVRECVAAKLYDYINGAVRKVSDRCAIQRAQARLIDSGGNLVKFATETLNESAQFVRKGN